MQGVRATVDDDRTITVEAVVGVRQIQHVQGEEVGLCCCTALRKTSGWTASTRRRSTKPSGISPSKEGASVAGSAASRLRAMLQARVCAYMAKGAEPLRS